MKTKDFLKILIICFLGIFLLSADIYAEEEYDFGQKDIENALPDEAAKELEEIGIHADEGVENITVGNVFEGIWKYICSAAVKPLRMLASLVGVIILSTLIQSMNHSENSMTSVFSAVGILACAGIVCTGIGSLISDSKTAIDGLSSFLSVYVPVFAGIMAANGQTATAAAYNGIITVMVELFCQVFTLFVFPLASCILGITVAGSFNPDLKISGIAEGAKKIVNWILAFVMTVFAGVLSVQSFVGSAADSAAMRAARFTVSGSVPIVGGAVADALLTVKESVGVIKASVGAYGIIASAAVMLPALLSLFLFRLILIVSASISDTFGVSGIKDLLKSGETVLSVVIAMIVSFWMIGVASTALMLVIGGGGT